MVPDDPDDEPITQPDRTRFPCPECEGKGEIEEETWRNGHLHRSVVRKCTMCMGSKWVNRAVFELFKAKRSGPTG